jgi:hypothetical protein
MTRSNFILLSIALTGVCIFAQTSRALQHNDVDEAIKGYLSSQKSEREDAQALGSAIADLNGDGKSEVVLVWAIMGPTYSHNTLTILSKIGTEYKAVASFRLIGEAELSSVKGGIIFVDQKVLAKNDPLCCPSIKKQGKYRWVGKKILEVKK